MYNNPTPALAAGGSGVLAWTGFDNVWYGLGAFALVAVGTAIMRIVPRKQA